MLRRPVFDSRAGRIPSLDSISAVLIRGVSEENLGFVELRNIRLGDPLLLITAIENRRTILGTHVRTLPVQLRGILSNREVEDTKQLAVSDFGWIVGDLDRLSMAGLAGAEQFLFGGLRRASGVSRSRADYTLRMLEHRLNSPEAATSDHRSLLAAGRRYRRINGRSRESGNCSINCLHAVTPAHVSTKIMADKRENKLDITSSFAAFGKQISRAGFVRVL